MARQAKIKKRKIAPDTRYGSVLVTQIINRSMRDGKKNASRKEVYGAMVLLAKSTGKEALDVLNEAIEKIKPQVEVRARRIGGAAYQVPSAVRSDRSQSLAIRWLVAAARKRPSTQYHSYAEKLSSELLDALKSEGGAMKKRDDVHRMAEANKAFAHFRW